jgi:hypothetical protein
LQLTDASLFVTKGYINGKWVDSADGVTFAVENPSTNISMGEVPNMPRSQIKEAIVSTQAARTVLIPDCCQSGPTCLVGVVGLRKTVVALGFASCYAFEC